MPESRGPEKICLFGGTFDPIHLGHLRIANEALKAFDLTRMLFVPSSRPPHKQAGAIAAFEDRFRMVQIACAPYPSFVASRLEADAAAESYTIDTLERFDKELRPGDELFFLIGADAFAEIATWNRWQDVIARVRFIVVSRPERAYTVPAGTIVLPLNGVEIPISSSDVREKLERGESVPEVPVEVREYIEQHGLYRRSEPALTASP